MGFLSGPISDRLRRMFGKDDPGWRPPSNRADHTRMRGKVPHGVEGKRLSGRHRAQKEAS